jgi:hypothetical protein
MFVDLLHLGAGGLRFNVADACHSILLSCALYA